MASNSDLGDLMPRIVSRLRPCSLRRCALMLTLLLALPSMAADLDDAKEAWAAGDLSSALIRLKGLLQENPDDPAARLLLGRIYLDNGDARAAQQELERARVNGAEDADLLAPLAQALLAQGKNRRVLALTEAPENAPPALLARLLALRGSALVSMDDVEAARKAFQQANETDPQASQPLLGLASLALRSGDMERTRALINQTIETAPEHSDGWKALGTLEYRARNYDEAVAAYDKALEYAGSKWMLHYQRGLAQLETEAPDRAWRDVKALQAAMPKFPGLQYLRGRLLLIDAKPEQALNQLEQYLLAAPDDPRAIYFAALALSQLERNAQAEEYLVRLHTSQPNNATVAMLLAKVRLDADDTAGAEAVMEPFIARADASIAMLELMRQALARQGRRDEASALIARAASQYPEAISAQIARAQSLQQQNKAEESAAILRRVIEQQPGNERARMLLIRAEMLAGNTDSASAAADAFVAQSPSSAMALSAKAAMLTQQGDRDAARATFEKALKVEPSFQRAALALAALELADDRADAARKVLDDLLTQDPGNTSAVLARAAIERGTSGDAAFIAQIDAGLNAAPDNLQLRSLLARLYLAQEATDKALQLLSQAPATQADEPTLIRLRAQAELTAGHPEQASSTLGRLAEIRPQSAEVRFMQATASAAGGDTRAMQLHLSEGLALDQRQVLGVNRLAALLAQVPTASERGQVIGALLRSAPEHPSVVAVNARYAVQRREFDQAIQDFDRLRQDYPNAQVYVLDLAEALRAAGREPRAMRVLGDWIRGHPKTTRPRLMLAQLQLKAGDSQAAAEQYRQIIEVDGNNPVALNNLAMLIANTSPREARDYAERALKLRPNDASFIDTMGTVLLALGEVEQARDLLAKANAGTPDPSIAFRYAKALLATGDSDGARRVLLQTQTRSFPEKAEADALYQELANSR